MTMVSDITAMEKQRIERRAMGIVQRAKVGEKSVGETPYSELRANTRLMQVLQQDWDSLYDFRQRYQRTCNYHRGRQWEDEVEDDEGNVVTEDEYIRAQGKLPLKQNIIRPLAKSLEGLFRTETGKSIVISRKEKKAELEKMLSNTLQAVLNTNKTREIDPRTFDLFILSGLPVQRIGYDYIDTERRYDVYIDYIDPQYIFFNTDIKDIRLTDLRRIGQIHDLTIDELFVHYAKTEADKEALKRLYSGISRDEIQNTYGLSSDRGKNLDFYIAQEPHKARVIELWEKRAVDIIDYWDQLKGEEGPWERGLAEIERINSERILMYMEKGVPEKQWLLIEWEQKTGFKWFYKILTPFGHTIREGESPYEHGQHPYVMYPYPLINGEVWGPIEDVIDQQKYINRLITLWDFIIGTSAKNTLILDKNSLDGQKPEDISADYRQVGGVIVLDLGKGREKPFELGGTLPNLGITELIGMQLKWMQDISGVQPAAQGQTGAAGTPAAKYAMEIQQTTLNNRDIMESFKSFRKDRDLKVVQTFLQFYKSKRYLAISGNDGTQLFDPEMIVDEVTDFDLVIGQSNDSPTYKTWVDEMLLDLWKQGVIDVTMFLKHSNLPFAEALMEDINNTNEQVNNGTMTPGAAINGIANKFNQQPGVNPAAINQLYGKVMEKGVGQRA